MGADPLEPLGQLVERARAAAAAADRSDLVERLSQTSRRLTHQGIRALVVGEFKQGKSLLVNAMVNAPDLRRRRRHRDLCADDGPAR